MTRTYQIVQQGQAWRILSNGKPLTWLYTQKSYAERAVRELLEKAGERAAHAQWRREHGITNRPRDSKKRKAYAAERAVPMLTDGPRLLQTPNVLEAMCVRWAREIGATPAVPQVRFSSRKRGACASGNQITLGSKADLGTLVHEYAHVLTWDEWPAHGPRWAEAYVKLVRVAFGKDLGPKMAEQLEQQFIKIRLIPRSAA